MEEGREGRMEGEKEGRKEARREGVHEGKDVRKKGKARKVNIDRKQ